MQRQLGIKRYEPVWAMMHKIRSAMGCRDKLYGLYDMVEFQEGYFTKGIRRGSKTMGYILPLVQLPANTCDVVADGIVSYLLNFRKLYFQ